MMTEHDRGWRPRLCRATTLIAALGATAGCRGEVLLHEPEFVEPQNTCGNGVNDWREVCDGDDLGGETCASIGQGDGVLACADTCTRFDVSGCTGPQPGCGNDLREGAEICDGTDIGVTTCGDLGWDGGILGCAADCSDFDQTGCFATPCGNGVAGAGEECDGADLRGTTCEELGLRSGELRCAADCLDFDTSACLDPVCGNGVVEGTELCDGADVGGLDCTDVGFGGGVLGCATDCFGYDTSGCFECGDGVAEGTELCDGADVGGLDCTDVGFAGGTLACQADCLAYDTSGCSICGDSLTEPPEVCDGADLGGLSCSDFGYPAGTLACRVDCTDYDLSLCNVGFCGDGVAVPPLEMCDGADLLGVTCVTLGFAGGTLACQADCLAFDTSGCTTSQQRDCCEATAVPGCTDTTIQDCICAFDPFCCNVSWDDLCVAEVASQGCGVCAATCGNNLTEPPEVCDGADLGGLSCSDFGYPVGMLGCTADCTDYDLLLCDIGALCGDGVAEPPLEMCDGLDLLGATCGSLGLGGGTLACAFDCIYDTSGCGVAAVCCAATPGTAGCSDPTIESCVCAQDMYCCQIEWDGLCVQEVGQFGCGACGTTVCGDGVADTGETCDGADLTGVTCWDLGFAGGTLACAPDCLGFDATACLPWDPCGNGIIEPPELCDGIDLGGVDCVQLGFNGGILACQADCFFDTSQCSTGPVCGDGVAQGTELCDGIDLRGLDCTIFGFTGGTLACGGGCVAFDTSGCTGGTAVCGNGVAEQMELCDGSDLRFITCQLLGYSGGGVLACDPGCYGFETSGCIGGGPVCGDNVAEGMEMCDGFDLRGMTCADFGLPSGTLVCTPSCSFDTSGCTVVSTCPDVDLGSATGQVVTGSTTGLENLRGGSCVGGSAPDVTFLWDAPYAASWTFHTVGSTYDTGLYLLDGSCTGPELACNDDTSGLQSQVTVDLIAGQTVIVVVDGWGSSNGDYVLTIAEVVPICGDSIIESPEVCDGNNLGGMTCADLGMPNGTLACTPFCAFDTSGCTIVSTCPDVDLGSATGQVATGSTTGLANQRGGSCVGSGAPDVTFLWDAPNAASWTFHTVGSTYDTGLYLLDGSCTGPELACNDDIPTGGLQSRITIDLIVGQTVILVVDGWGTSNGDYVLTIAEAAPICGDSVIESPEVCDGNNLGGMTCQTFGFTSGSLACLATCLDFDVSGCGNSTSDCCTANSSSGCSDPDIQACVCAIDVYCCQVQWDDICVSEVTERGCGSCTGLPGNCCVSTPGVSGCNDATIEACVCAADNYCCDQQWDGRCVGDVEDYSCGTCTSP